MQLIRLMRAPRLQADQPEPIYFNPNQPFMLQPSRDPCRTILTIAGQQIEVMGECSLLAMHLRAEWNDDIPTEMVTPETADSRAQPDPILLTVTQDEPLDREEHDDVPF